MASLALGGMFAVLGLIIGLGMSVIGLFFGDIISLNSIGIGLISGSFLRLTFKVPIAPAILIGIVVAMVFMYLSHHEYGFWVISSIMSIVWGLFITAVISGSNVFWQWITFFIVTGIVLLLHVNARDRA